MAQYIFKPIDNVHTLNDEGNYGNKLIFREIVNDYNYSPVSDQNTKAISFESVVSKGNYVYSLTKFGSNELNQEKDYDITRPYPLDDLKGVVVTDIKKIESTSGNLIQVTLSENLQAPVNGEKEIGRSDFFLFDRFFNKVNLAKIGLDKKPAQLVEGYVDLYDLKSGQILQDASANTLFTREKTFFSDALKSINATSLVVTNNTEKPVRIAENFPSTTEVSNSLLGVPRAEEQLSLFSDVSTLGLDEANWEFFTFSKPFYRKPEWEERASVQGNRYNAKLIENIGEQALELSSNPVPYTYPWSEGDLVGGYRQKEYNKYKAFIILGNMLWLYYEGTGKENQFLNPYEARWGITGGQSFKGIQEEYFQEVQFGDNVNEALGFRIIDYWTTTWMGIRRGENSTTTESFINDQIFNLNANSELIKKLKDVYRELDTKTAGLLIGVIESFFTFTHKFSPDEEKGTQPGYITKATQQVILQSKEVYRYQPGRISGFTFGTRVDIDELSLDNYAEWGCVNESDEYVFKFSGGRLSIIRRSTVPLTSQSLSLSGGFKESDQKVFEDFKPVIGGKVRDKFYELEIGQDRFNGDALDGNGPSGYRIDPKNVTMWKIEFSWYGAIGVQFYAYVPVGSAEARWVKLHRIIIENSLPTANLQDPYFKMRYNLVVGDRTVTSDPQFIYKYGSSVYIDGGDEGTRTVTSYESKQKVIFEDFDAPISVANSTTDQNNFVPMLGLRNKRFIFNSDGISRPSRILALPQTLTVSTDRLIEVDVVECEGGPDGFGFTYDNGLRWNPNASPGIAKINNTPSYNNFSSGTFVNSANVDLSPYASRLIDFVFGDDGTNKKNVYKLSLIKQDNVSIVNGEIVRDKSLEFPRKYIKLNPTTDSPLMLDESFDNAKIMVPGINNCYIDWFETIQDSTIEKRVSAITGKTLVSEFRLRQIYEIDNETFDSRIITPEAPLFKSNFTGNYFESGSANIAVNWTNYKSFANPRLPRNKYKDSTLNHASPSRTLTGEFEYNFRTNYENIGSKPPFELKADITDNQGFWYPFRVFRNGLIVSHYIRRSAFREYNSSETNEGDGFCVPYSYGFGMTSLQKENSALATTDASFSGKSIICRFLNPHASGVGLTEYVYNGAKTTLKTPQFQIGFTNKKPARKIMDGNDQQPGDNEKWNGLFESPGGEGPLDKKDYIYVEYEQFHRNTNRVGEGDMAESRGSGRNNQLLQNDYRVKHVLNEGQSSELGYHIGGANSYVRLEVDPEFTKFSSLTYHSTFTDFVNVYTGTGYSGEVDIPDRLYFEGYDRASVYDDDNMYKFTDFPEMEFSNVNNYMVIRDSDSKFAESLEADLDIQGGQLILESVDNQVTTSVRIISKVLKFYYYATNTGDIIADAYPNGLQTGYLVQLNGDPEPTFGGALGATTKLLFKIVKLKYPDGINGTEEKELQKVFSGGTEEFWPVIKLRENAQINNINYKLEKPGEPPSVISPVWKIYGATEVISPITANSPQGAAGGLLDNDDSEPNGVKASIPESFIEKSRLSGLQFTGDSNKRLRKSVSDPLFKALPNDPAAYQRIASTGVVLYDKRGKLAEKAKRLTSYYLGPKDNTGLYGSVEIPLQATFGEDRNKLLPDQLGTKAVFFRAQKVNLEDVENSANVRMAVNVSEL